MASIIKTANGKYRASINFQVDGQRKPKTKTFDTKAEARAWSADMEAQKSEGYDERRDWFFPDYFDWWVDTYKRSLATQTIKQYEVSAKIARGYFANVRLSSINRAHFQTFLNNFGANHAKETVKKRKTHFTAALRDAVDEKLIDNDPTYRSKLTGQAGKSAELKYLELVDMEKVIEHIKALNPSVGRFIVFTGILSGARIGELRALKFDDLNQENKTVRIDQSFDDHFNELKETKNASSTRTITMPDMWWQELDRYLEHGKSGELFIFGDRPITGTGANKELREILKAIKASKTVTFHGLRHTHASYLIANDISIQYVSERLGHSSTAVTQNVYTHLLDSKRSDEIKKAMDLFA